MGAGGSTANIPQVRVPSPIGPSRIEICLDQIERNIRILSDDEKLKINCIYQSFLYAIPKDGFIQTLTALQTEEDISLFCFYAQVLYESGWDSLTNHDFGTLTFFHFAAMFSDPAQLLELFQATCACLSILKPDPDAVNKFFQRLFAYGGSDRTFFSPPGVFSLANPSQAKVCKTLTKRVKKYATYLRDIKSKLTFAFPAATFSIEASNGDLHQNFVAPLRIEGDLGKTTKVWFYKPRSSLPEEFMNEAIDLLNKDSHHTFPILPLIELHSDDGKMLDDTKLMGEVKRTKKLSNIVQGLGFARALGALQCLAKVMGMTDLHYENVIATDLGPVIIDAECIFLRSVLRSSDLDATQLIEAFYKFPPDSAGAFTVGDGLFFEHLAKSPEFSDALRVGYQEAAAICMRQKSSFTTIYTKALKDPHFRPRFVPLETSMLTQSCDSFLMENPVYWIIPSVTKGIIRALNDCGYPCPPYVSFFHQENGQTFITVLTQDLSMTAIPMFTMTYDFVRQSTSVFIDDFLLCNFSSVTINELESEFESNIDNLLCYHSRYFTLPDPKEGAPK